MLRQTWTACKNKSTSWRMVKLIYRNSWWEPTQSSLRWKQSSTRKCLADWKNWRMPSKCKQSSSDNNRSFSLTWPAAILVQRNKRNYLHKKRVQFSEGYPCTPIWPPLLCFGTPTWTPWRHVKTIYSPSPPPRPPPPHISHKPPLTRTKVASNAVVFRGVIFQWGGSEILSDVILHIYLNNWGGGGGGNVCYYWSL